MRGGTSRVTLAKMADGTEFLMRPVLRGMCLYESLKDGSVDLADVARMNDAIDVEEENFRRSKPNG